MGAVEDMLQRMREQRASIQVELSKVTEEQMLVPVQMRDQQVSVRFMFYRLIGHEVEHTVQMVKTLKGIGKFQTEAQLILSRLQSARGELEGLLLGLEDGDLDQTPAEGEWSPRQVLEHIIEVEASYTKRVMDALPPAAGTAS
jgi:uncharacterized damage-inducible protein DinB